MRANEYVITFNVRTSDPVGHINITFDDGVRGDRYTVGLNTTYIGTEALGSNRIFDFIDGIITAGDPDPIRIPLNDGVVRIEQPNTDLRRSIYVDKRHYEAALRYANSKMGPVDYALFTQACVDFANEIYIRAGGAGTVGNLFAQGEINNAIGLRLSNEWQTRLGWGRSIVTDDKTYASVVSLLQRAIVEPQCFPADTPVLRPDGSHTQISDLRVGDQVLAFDPSSDNGRGTMVARPITRLFQSLTREWLLLTWSTDGRLVTTPGHHFLSADGRFRTIADIVAADSQIVLADGTIGIVSASQLSFAESAEAFASGVDIQALSAGSLALAPFRQEGWRTYNFEVDGFHTYVAGGVRVHNQSAFIASGKDMPTGTYTSKSGDILVVRNDGSIFNKTTGKVSAPAAQQAKFVAFEGMTSTQRKDIKENGGGFAFEVTKPGSGPVVTIVSGKKLAAGTEWSSTSGYRYRANADGSITNLDTDKISSPATAQTEQAKPYKGGATGGTGNGNKSSNTSTSVTIKSGDTLSGIAAKNGTTVKAIMAANPNIKDPNKIQAGKTLIVPKARPILLDLDGDGLEVTELGSSSAFYDMAGDGVQHRTAWAGVGDGVLVRDGGNDGVIKLRNEIDFTEWDPSAKSDMDAILHVFDTNHDGTLSAGDADWALFKVLVTNQDGTTSLKSMAELGIASINLTPDNRETVLADGSKILGTTNYTKVTGETGVAGDASLAYDVAGHVIATTVVVNGDGSTTVTNKGTHTDGSLAYKAVTTTSADGLARSISVDADGDGISDSIQTTTRVINGDGSAVETISNFDGSGTILVGRKRTVANADKTAVTISYDLDGSGAYERTETFTKSGDGSHTIVITTHNDDGSVRNERTTVISADGLTRTVQTELTGSGAINAIQVEATSFSGDGTRTDTVTNYAGSGTSSGNKIAQSVVTSSADGATQSAAADLDGNGSTDVAVDTTIVRNVDGSTTTTQTTTNANSSVRQRARTQLSGNGLSETRETDVSGDGTYDHSTAEVTTINGDGSITKTVTEKAGNGTKLSETIATRSADGKTRSTSVDANGDGMVDATETVALVGGNLVETQSKYSPNGATLLARSAATTSADGLSQTVQTDANGDSVNDRTQSVTTVINPDGSATTTMVDKNGDGTIQVGKTIEVTSADGLTTTIENYLGTQVSPFAKVVDALVLNGDGSTTQTVTRYAGTNAVQVAKTVSTIGANRLSKTTQSYVGTNASPELVVSLVEASNGTKTTTRSLYSADGATLLDRQVGVQSADGLSLTTTRDVNGEGVTDATETNVLTLNSDGSTSKVVTSYRGNGTAGANKVASQTVSTTANGLTVTAEGDSDGDGTLDGKVVDATVLNSDGSRTRTQSRYNGSGLTLLERTISTTGGNGLVSISSHDANGDGTADSSMTTTQSVNADGSTLATAERRSGSGALLGSVVTTKSVNGLTSTIETDLDGNGIDDVVTTAAIGATGSVVAETSTYNASNVLTSRHTETTSGTGLSVSSTTDLDGNGTVDRSTTQTTVLNADGSSTTTLSSFKAGGALDNQIVAAKSADGLAVTTQFDGTGAGSYSRTMSETVVVNADGSTTTTTTNLNSNGSLHNKTIETLAATGLGKTTTFDANGDNTVDQTIIATRNADGSGLTSAMHGTVLDASGRKYGAVKGRYDAVSADGLSVTTRFDGTGDGLAERQTTDVTVLNTDGTTVRTVTHANLSGGSAGSANPTYTVTPTEKEVTTSSNDGLSVTTQWDLTGSGTLTKSETQETLLTANGSETVTVSAFDGATLKRRRAVTSSGDGLSETSQWDLAGTGTYSEVLTDVTAINASGTTTRTETANTSVGALIAKTITTTSADGRTTTIERDPTGSGAVTETSVVADRTLADGSTVEVLSVFGVGSVLQRKSTTETSSDGAKVTIQHDADGDGTIDQTISAVELIDGSSTTTTMDLSGAGAMLTKTVSTTSWDGLTTSTQRWLDGDAVMDRTGTATRTLYADGSSVEVVQIYRTSQLISGVWQSVSPMLLQTITETTSADGRTATTTVDVDGNGSVDETSSAATKVDGSVVTTTTDNTTARALGATLGKIAWTSAIASADKTVAAATIRTTSGDGLTETIQADYDGNGTYEHTETWTTRIDGAKTGTITDVNASSVVVAQGTQTVSADGLTTTLNADMQNNGFVEHKETSVIRADGSIVKTVVDLNTDGTNKLTVESHVGAASQLLYYVITGSAAVDTLTGSIGNDTIDGKSGADTMIGGGGDDTYIVDNSSDVTTELASEGTDTLRSSVTYTLGNNVENLILTGSSAINGTGNSLANLLTGNGANNQITGGDGNDTLDGGAGNDTMIGGLGNDTFIVDSTSDVVTESASQGTDLVMASATFTLGSNVENLTLTGGAAVNGTGNTAANLITGNSAANVLDGGSGADTLIGGDGNDTYVVDTAGDAVTELANQGIDLVQSSITYALGANLENLTLTGSSVINGTGNAAANVILGNSGNNVLDGGLGGDALTGGAGNDTYVVDDAGDSVVEVVGEGADLVQSTVTYSLSVNVENLTLLGGSAINATGNGDANVLTGNSANNVLNGGAGADTMAGGGGDDTYVVDNASDVVTEASGQGTDLIESSVTYTLGANLENLTLTGAIIINGTGNELANILLGNSANNILTGGLGNDSLDGGAGNDTLIGGDGNDTYVVNSSGDSVTEAASQGTDLVLSSITYTLGTNVENLTLTGTSAISGTGNGVANIINGNAANNVLSGGAGNDALYGGDGNDTLDGGADVDTLMGGDGNDTYVVDNVGDVISETGNGVDVVQSSIAFSLAALSAIENLTLTGSAAINGTGNASANVLTGNSGSNTLDGGAGNDTLNGGAGADTLIGGDGDDTYVVDNISDSVVESGTGTDTVQSSVTYSIASLAAVESLTLTGSGATNATGNAAANIITGNGGANILDGGLGADTLVGGAGNDTYIFDSADTIVELVNGGTDTIIVDYSYALGAIANIENLTLGGAAAINGTGTSGNNVLTGNGADNVLDGGAGADKLDGQGGNDTLIGGLDNDTYVVDGGDIIVEFANEGTDTVQSTSSFSMAGFLNVENLTLTGAALVDATGNDQNNIITGNSGGNVLDGGAGDDNLQGAGGIDTLLGGLGNDYLDGGAAADVLVGGMGDDRYRVDGVGDSISEMAGEGFDTVIAAASMSISLADNVEALVFTNLGSGTGTGNGSNNILAGLGGLPFGGGANTLSGAGGDDLLIGGTGADTLTGGTGNDWFVYEWVSDSGATETTRDQILDFQDGDRILLGGTIGPLFSGIEFSLDTDGSFSLNEIRQTVLGNDLLIEVNANYDSAAEMTILLTDRQSLLTIDDFISPDVLLKGNSNVNLVSSSGTISTGDYIFNLTITPVLEPEIYVVGGHNAATTVDASIKMWSDSSLLLIGGGNVVEMSTGSSLATLEGRNSIVAAGSGIAIDGSSEGNDISLGAASSATTNGDNNVVIFGHDSSIVANGDHDTFIFSLGIGQSALAGFDASGADGDTIQIDDALFADWATLLAASSQSGNDVIITASANDTITLKNIALGDLQQSNFVFQ